MSKIELLAKIELLNKYEAMMEELKSEADSIRNTIKAEMEAREVEELIAGQYIIRWTPVLSSRFDSAAFKKVLPELYQAYTKQVSSRRFTISAYPAGQQPRPTRRRKEDVCIRRLVDGKGRSLCQTLPSEQRVSQAAERVV